MADIIPVKAIRSGADVVALGEYVSTDTIAATRLNINGATEIDAALVDADELPVYDASATANKKSLLSRLWAYIKAKIAGEAVPIGGTTPAAGAFTTLNATTGTFSTSSNGYVSSTFENTSAGSSAVNRIQIGNNTSSGAAQIVVYGGSYPTIANYLDLTNANGLPIRMMVGSTAAGTFSSTGLSVAGITFLSTPSVNATSSILDDYEEGTWTPTITTIGGAAPTGVTYSTQIGKYTKIGNTVHVELSITLTNKGTGGSGGVGIAGFPFTAAAAIGHSSPLYFVNLSVGWTFVQLQSRSSATSFYVVGNKSAQVSTSYLDYPTDISNTLTLLGSFTYLV